MDPERIHSYLQAACAGLGFDIGEVWFSAVDGKSAKNIATAVHRIEVGSKNFEPSRKIKYLQLYTSKSYGSPQDLIRPDSEDGEDSQQPRKHVLSPTLVNAIATNAQVVWANCQKKEGLLGKSRMRLQTAVGMPVAMDAYGNMCIVVMFSLRSVQSTKEAMEFIKLISQGAASSQIPCLLPVVDSTQKQLDYDPQKFREWQKNEAYLQQIEAQRSMFSEMNKNNGTSNLAKDNYGIPILPEFAELLNDGDSNNNSTQKRLSFLADNSETSDDYDNSTFGLWSTIMNGPTMKKTETAIQQQGNQSPAGVQSKLNYFDPERRVRVEEFVTAFLGFSVFDIADVWAPVSEANGTVSLHNVLTANSETTETFPNVSYFKNVSKNVTIKPWSGAVGRAYSTGTPIWSTNKDLVVDMERSHAFYTADINSVLSIPILYNNVAAASQPCIICFYSFVRTDSSTFVIRFIQQALHTLWEGLDTVDVHESIGTEQWQGVSAAQIGEMAADVELQRALYNRKRTHDLMQESSSTSTEVGTETGTEASSQEGPAGKRTHRASSFFEQLQSLAGEYPLSPSISDGQDVHRTNRSSSFLDQIQSLTGDNFNIPQLYIPPPGAQAQAQPTPGKPRSSSLVVQLQTLNGENMKETNNIQVQAQAAAPQAFAFSMPPNELNSLQNLATAAQQAPIQPVDIVEASPQVFKGDDLKSNANNINEVVVQTGLDQLAMAVDTSQLGSTVYPTSQICIPVSATTTTQYPVPLLPPAPLPAASSSSVATSSVATSSVKSNKKKPRICRIEGCNDESVARRPYCSRHTGNRICEYVGGCTKCAQGATRFCIAHGGGRRCTFPGCDKGARDKFFCAAHGGGKRCRIEGCKKSAVGGSKLCTSHGGGKRCEVEGCMKSAQSSTKFCVKHGGGKKCSHQGCNKVARGRTNFCASHGGGVRCKLDGCNRIAIGKLQLCRAHGGGAGKAKKKGSQEVDNDDTSHYMADLVGTDQCIVAPPMDSSMLYPHKM